ncbi:MAG TPA: hypothetical protein VFZ65_23025 [Planctomycetota bacterium]|nr:hypothetical protein [Planctomycetota bacterium]
MNRFPCLSLTAIGLAGLSTISAQAPVPLSALDTISPITAGPTAPDGSQAGIWGAGRNYKVSFHDGMAFYPYVGPDLPHQPLRWRTTSVRAGSTELLRNAAAPAPHWTDTRCEFDLGAVTERYDLQTGGLEQSFVVHERPAAGDLVITGVVTTPLQLETANDHSGPLALRLPDGRAVVEYGAAFAVDAVGERTPLATECDGATIRLRVPAATMAQAHFPLVVDPFLGNVLLESGGALIDVDVLHETLTAATTPARNWVVYSRVAAAGDADIWIKRFGDDFTGAATPCYQEISLIDARHGQLALAPGANRVVMAYALDNPPVRAIAIHMHDTNDLVLRTSIDTPFFANGNSDWRPDVGGRNGSIGTKVLIVFQRENVMPWANTNTSTVYGTVIDAAIGATMLAVAPFQLRTRPNADQERPVCNQSSAGTNWVVAFQENLGNVVNDDWDILTVAVGSTGVVSSSEVLTEQAGNPLIHSVGPQIAGSAGRYLLTYTTRAFQLMNPKPSSVQGDTLYAQRIDWDHTADVGSLPHPAVVLDSLPTNDLIAEGCAYDTVSKSHWAVVSSDQAAGNFRMRRVGYTGNEVENRLYTLTTGATAVAMATSFDSEKREFPVAVAANLTTGSGRLNGNVLQYAVVAPPATIGFACGSGVWDGLTATGNRQRIGSEDMTLKLTNAPQDTIALLMLSTAELDLPGSLFGAPGCTLVPDILGVGSLGIVTATIAGGQASLALDLPEFLTPFTLYAQWGYLVPGANDLGILASEGLSVPIAF